MKSSKLSVSILSVVFIAALSLIIVQSAAGDETIVVISAPTGGDCSTVGTWNAKTKTCKLTEDIDLSSVGGDGITIASDEITLLCNGHSITGDRSYSSTGILAAETSGVTIKNCNVQNFYWGISLSGSVEQPTNNTVKNNTANSNFAGINLQFSNSNTVNNNTLDSNDYGISLLFSNSNTMMTTPLITTRVTAMLTCLLLHPTSIMTMNVRAILREDQTRQTCVVLSRDAGTGCL